MTAQSSVLQTSADRPPPPTPDQINRGNYRDYLVTVWVFAMQNGDQVPDAEVAAKFAATSIDQNGPFVAMLADRFHQHFRSYNFLSVVANEFLVPILTEILTAPTGPRAGFGLATSAIPSRKNGEAARSYLDSLITLSKVSAEELERRFRVRFDRYDSEMTNEVEENITALLGLLRDTFQSRPEPFAADPNPLNGPLIPATYQGFAPFFLEYDEWLAAQAHYWAENEFDLRMAAALNGMWTSTPALRPAQNYTYDDFQNLVNSLLKSQKVETLPGNDPRSWFFALLDQLLQAHAEILEGHRQRDLGEHTIALGHYVAAQNLLIGKLYVPKLPNPPDTFDPFTSEYFNANVSFDDATVRSWLTQKFEARRAQAVPSRTALPSLYTTTNGAGPYWSYDANNEPHLDIMNHVLSSNPLNIAYLGLVAIPCWIGDCFFSLGDYPSATKQYSVVTRFLVGAAELDGRPGYAFTSTFSPRPTPLLYQGQAPYTSVVSSKSGLAGQFPKDAMDGVAAYTGYAPGGSAPATIAPGPSEISISYSDLYAHLHPIDVAVAALRQGRALSEWADQLYRSRSDGNVARARELYKAVVMLHRGDTGLDPNFPGQPPKLPLLLLNPAVRSQVSEAQLRLFQIRNGLNFLGYPTGYVPTLRYAALRQAAESFAARAKSAEQNLISAISRLEDLLENEIKLQSAFREAQLQQSIAQQQQAEASIQVQQAQFQVSQVQSQIAAKEAEIADHDSLFGQVGDYVSGFLGFLSPDQASKVWSKGGDAGTTLGIGATGGSLLAGFGAFWVGSYIALNAMGSAQNQRQAELTNLIDHVLPNTQLGVNIAQRDVVIAELRQQIAREDAQLAQSLLRFQSQRTLNVAFWAQVAETTRRVLKSYLEYAARFAWLAQAALGYEQDRAIDIIRFDYFPAATQNVTGADLLQLDLSSLEAQRLQFVQAMRPIKHVISLAKDAPLAWGQLKKTGMCTFSTFAADFAAIYPGTSYHRLRTAVASSIGLPGVAPYRGTLSNLGISAPAPWSAVESGAVRPLVRGPDVMPMSAFELNSDMTAFGLPDENLFAFEGLGLETNWTIVVPKLEHPQALDGLVDVLITLDIRAAYTQESQSRRLAPERLFLISARRLSETNAASIDSKQGDIAIVFEAMSAGLASALHGKKVSNLIVIGVGDPSTALQGSLEAITEKKSVAFSANGWAISNAGPLATSTKIPPSPLNVLAGAQADQPFKITLKRPPPSPSGSTLVDVVLGLDLEPQP